MEVHLPGGRGSLATRQSPFPARFMSQQFCDVGGNFEQAAGGAAG
jgi:hypothetical protein